MQRKGLNISQEEFLEENEEKIPKLFVEMNKIFCHKKHFLKILDKDSEAYQNFRQKIFIVSVLDALKTFKKTSRINKSEEIEIKYSKDEIAEERAAIEVELQYTVNEEEFFYLLTLLDKEIVQVSYINELWKLGTFDFFDEGKNGLISFNNVMYIFFMLVAKKHDLLPHFLDFQFDTFKSFIYLCQEEDKLDLVTMQNYAEFLFIKPSFFRGGLVRFGYRETKCFTQEEFHIFLMRLLTSDIVEILFDSSVGGSSQRITHANGFNLKKKCIIQ